MAKKKHGGHHGGAWKVAYADFVTAMMALFLVLWLASQDQKIKEAIQRSFRNPLQPLTLEGGGILPNKDPQPVFRDSQNFNPSAVVELSVLRRIFQDLNKDLPTNPDAPEENSMKLELIPDGVRVNIFDRSKRPIFDAESAEFTRYGEWVITSLAWSIGRYARAFQVELEGHTEAGHPPRNDTYTKWELSSDRANSARRKLLEHGIPEAQIRKVAGFGDVNPMKDTDPRDEANRRVTVILKVKPTDGR